MRLAFLSLILHAIMRLGFLPFLSVLFPRCLAYSRVCNSFIFFDYADNTTRGEPNSKEIKN
jgi:hypothetical protein